jgi:hypothetical protein
MSKDENMFSAAEEIAGGEKYEEIVEKLRASGIFPACIERTRNLYESRLHPDNFVMTDRDFEMLAVLHLYDTETVLHSIRTFELAYRIVTHPFLLPSGETLVFGDHLASSGVSLEQFLRAALFHDIGKVLIPREVLHNALDDEEVLVKMFPEEKIEKQGEYEKRIILKDLYGNGIRPIDVVPLKELFTGEKYTELLCRLEKRGFSETATLKDVLRTHEPESERILASFGYKIEGRLAGTHHNYRKETPVHFIKTVYGNFAIADLIRIVDVTDALQSARWYKRPLSELEVLFILADDAKHERIDPFIASLWINNQYTELLERIKKANVAFSEDEKEEARFIESFLEERRAEHRT